jgi:hypothetical protein
MQRHARQSRLAGVGPAGQARIARAQVDVTLDGLAADVAVRYLAGAGVARLRVREVAIGEVARAIDAAVVVEVDATPAAPRLAGEEGLGVDWLADPIAQQLAAGALAALRAVRRALQAPS